jgi:hypothetical protein
VESEFGYLSISENGGRRWVFLFKRDGKAREMGLGAASAVGLAACAWSRRRRTGGGCKGPGPYRGTRGAEAGRG